MKIKGNFYDRISTPECSEDRTAVSNVVKMESELHVYAHNVCHKIMRGLSSLKTSSYNQVTSSWPCSLTHKR